MKYALKYIFYKSPVKTFVG